MISLRLTAAAVLTAFLFHSSIAVAQDPPSVFMATGFKVTEVTQTSATVWTRLTLHPERNLTGPDFGPKAEAVPEGKTLGEMFASVPGTNGEVRVIYGTSQTPAAHTTEWQAVKEPEDFTCLFHLQDLQPGQDYVITVEGRSAGADAVAVEQTGSFTTAPADEAAADVSFMVVTGQDDDRRDDPQNGHKIYKHMLTLNPDFFVHTGDVVYFDKATPWAKNAELARYKWHATYALPFQRSFHRETSSYFMRDDHDTTRDDSWPGKDYGDLTWEQGLKIFEEQTGLSPQQPYRTVRWGKDLQVWMMEGRKFRSANKDPDGPQKTIWGEEQKQWFFDTVKNSDATFRILISPTPIVGPDRKNKNDNHANTGFTHEGDQIRQFVASQKNMFIVCGDRHWQYVSVDPKTNVREYSCGPTSNEHAGGWKDEYRSPMHKYLKVQGGFLRVEVKTETMPPQITFAHHKANGELANTETHVAK